MKNKKGFTLIELLAVIVILAIIALIVTPVVSNIVANARIAANARSVEGHIRNIELAIITKAFGENSTGDLDSFDTITSGATIESSLSRPGNDNVTCTSYTIKHGTVFNASGCKDNENKWGKVYRYSVSGGAVVEGSLEVITYNVYKPGDLVFFDPVSNAVCSSDTFDLENIVTFSKEWDDAANNGDGGYVFKGTGTSTCYKWRVITVGDSASTSTVTLQLDHNLINEIAWNNDGSQGLSNYGPKVLFESLATTTSEWERVPLLNYTYDTTLGGTNIYSYDEESSQYTGINYGILSCSDGICTTTCDENDEGEYACVAGTMNTTSLRVRAITGEEIRALTMDAGASSSSAAATWTLAAPTYDGTSDEYAFYFSNANYEIGSYTSYDYYIETPSDERTTLSWLNENLGGYDVYNEVKLSKYWTLSPTTNSYNGVWYVEEYGNFDSYYDYYAGDEYNFGARPVITVEKSMIG